MTALGVLGLMWVVFEGVRFGRRVAAANRSLNRLIASPPPEARR